MTARIRRARLLNVNGTLYGTTSYGGVMVGYYSVGTVFSVTPSGTEKILHSFKVSLLVLPPK